MNELTNTTEPQIAYSECYAQVFSRLFFGDCLIESVVDACLFVERKKQWILEKLSREAVLKREF